MVLRISSNGGTMALENRGFLLKKLHAAAHKVPDRGVLRHNAQQFLPIPANYKGRIRLLHRFGLAVRVFDLVVGACKARCGFGPHVLDDLTCLTKAPYAFSASIEGNPIGVVLGLVVALADARADAEIQATI